MHEFVENREVVKVITDDFLIAGFGSGDQEVNNMQSRKKRTRFSRELAPVEPEVESYQNETAPVKCEIHGLLFTSQGLRPDPDLGHITDS